MNDRLKMTLLTEVAAQKYVKEAQRQGLSCNVTEVKFICIQTQRSVVTSSCAAKHHEQNEQMARDASVGSYLAEAKQRGLQCGVVDAVFHCKTIDLHRENDFNVGEV